MFPKNLSEVPGTTAQQTISYKLLKAVHLSDSLCVTDNAFVVNYNSGIGPPTGNSDSGCTGLKRPQPAHDPANSIYTDLFPIDKGTGFNRIYNSSRKSPAFESNRTK